MDFLGIEFCKSVNFYKPVWYHLLSSKLIFSSLRRYFYITFNIFKSLFGCTVIFLGDYTLSNYF